MPKKFKTAMWATVFACCAIGTPAQKVPGPEPPPQFQQLYHMPVVYSVANMDRVGVRRDIVYKSIAGSTNGVAPNLDLKFDAYLPEEAKPEKRFPVVVLISGGGAEPPYDWRDAGVYAGYGRILAASGFVGITFAKRFARGSVGTLEGLEDFNDMVHYVRDHASDLHVDPDRMAFWAFSAGGFLLSPVLSQMQPYARAAICFYCVTGMDFPSITEADRAKLSPLLSPLAQIERSSNRVPPVFVGRAGRDSEDLNRNLDRFIAAALARNVDIEVLNHPHGRHSFDIIDDVPRSREIIRQAIEFLKERLEPERKVLGG